MVQHAGYSDAYEECPTLLLTFWKKCCIELNARDWALVLTRDMCVYGGRNCLPVTAEQGGAELTPV